MLLRAALTFLIYSAAKEKKSRQRTYQQPQLSGHRLADTAKSYIIRLASPLPSFTSDNRVVSIPASAVRVWRPLAGAASGIKSPGMIDCFGVVFGPDTLFSGREGGGRSFSQKTKTHVNAKNARKMFTTLAAATPTWLLWACWCRRYVFPCAFQLFVAANSIKICLCLRS